MILTKKKCYFKNGYLKICCYIVGTSELDVRN